MCDFYDETNALLEIGDRVEYWSPSYKEWFKATVSEIQSTREMKHVENSAGGWDMVPVTTTKILVRRDANSHNRFSTDQRLSKSASVRKLV